jgi:hypothetical protein
VRISAEKKNGKMLKESRNNYEGREREKKKDLDV